MGKKKKKNGGGGVYSTKTLNAQSRAQIRCQSHYSGREDFTLLTTIDKLSGLLFSSSFTAFLVLFEHRRHKSLPKFTLSAKRSLECCCLLAKSCLPFCDTMDCSTLGSSVLYYLLELAQIKFHWVSDAI